MSDGEDANVISIVGWEPKSFTSPIVSDGVVEIDFLRCLGLMNMFMMVNPDPKVIAAAMPEDELDELTAGNPMGQLIQWLTDVALALYARKDGG